MPDVFIHSTYMVHASGIGEYTLRFENVKDAGAIAAVYKINSEGEWIKLPAMITGSTVEITMAAGDPSVVFAYPVPELSNDNTNTNTASPVRNGGGGESLPKDSDGDGIIDSEDSNPTAINLSQKLKGIFSGASTTSFGENSRPVAEAASTSGAEEEAPGFGCFAGIVMVLAVGYFVRRSIRGS